MPKFYVDTIVEVSRVITIEARDADEARAMVAAGKGETEEEVEGAIDIIDVAEDKEE